MSGLEPVDILFTLCPGSELELLLDHFLHEWLRFVSRDRQDDKDKNWIDPAVFGLQDLAGLVKS